MSNYSADIIRGSFINAPASFTPMDSPYSRAFNGTNEQFQERMLANESLFNSGASIYDRALPLPTTNPVNYDFFAQQELWQKLNGSLNTTRTTGQPTKLIGFDFETLAADVVRPYMPNSSMAITELGITETIVKKTKTSSVSHSIAGGINESQLLEYLKYYKTFSEEGLSELSKPQRQFVESLMDRLSVYGQGNIDNLFELKHITNLGDVVTVNPLYAQSGKSASAEAIERGLMHLSVLGGISEDSWRNALKEAGVISNQSYIGAIGRFKSAGLVTQRFEKGSALSNKVAKYFGKQSDNSFVLGFNSNPFDLNIFSQRIDDTLTRQNTIDVYTGFKVMSGGQDVSVAAKIASQNGLDRGITRLTSQEGLATAQGITTGVAHNAEYDSRVVTELIAKTDFYDGKSLPELVAGTKVSLPNAISENKKIYYALNSIGFDKNGSDYLASGSMLSVSGVQRGKYYYIDDIREYQDGRVGVKFSSAIEDVNESFIKVVDSVQDLEKLIQTNFLIDNDASKSSSVAPGKRLKMLNRNISDADRARRNYEGLFGVDDITYNASTKQLEGGYERLNQYYRAYGISAHKIGEITPETISKIANGEFDEQLIAALQEASGAEEIYPSTLRDFRAMYGRIHNDSEMLGYIDEVLDGTELNAYQKTLVAKRIRDGVTQVSDVTPVKDYSTAARRDLFDLELNIGDGPTRINFEGAGAVDSLSKNFYRKSGATSSIGVAESMGNAVIDLYERGIVDGAFLKDFFRASGIRPQTEISNKDLAEEISKFKVRPTTEIQPRKLAEMIASHIQTTYINPIQSKGYTYAKFTASNGDFSELGDERLINFMSKKTQTLSGNISLSKAMSGGTIAITDAFRNGEVQKILSDIGSAKYALNPDEIKTVLMGNLGHTEETANEILRMLSSKGKYGLGTFKNGKHPMFISQFVHSGNVGEDAYVLVNFNEARNSNLAKTMEIMTNGSMSFNEKINLIKENGYSSVLPIKAIQRYEVAPNEDLYVDPTLKITGIDGKVVNPSYDSITVGESGYRKISQYHLGIWDKDSDDLSDWDLTLTDDATSVSQAYRRTRKSLFDPSQVTSIVNDSSLSESEKHKMISKIFKKTEDRIITDMPGPTGYTSLFANGQWIKANIPTVSDTLLSSQVSVQPLELLVLQTAKKDLEVAQQISKGGTHLITDMLVALSGQDPTRPIDAINSMITKAKAGENINPQFNEFFYKHLLTPMNLEEGEFANSINMSFMDYIQESMKKEGYYSPKTKNTLQWLIDNVANMSQISKEKATQDKKLYLIDAVRFNQNAHMSSTIRPISNQIQNNKPYIVKNVQAQMGDVAEKLGITFGYEYLPLQEAQRRNALRNFEIAGTGITYGDLESAMTVNIKQMDSTELISKLQQIEQRLTTDDDWFDSIYRGVLTKYNGLTKDSTRELLLEAFSLAKANSSSVFSDRLIARPSFANNELFTAPDIRTVEINALDEAEFNYLLSKDKSPLKKILKNGHITRGTVLDLGDRTVEYSGPSGKISGDVKDFFLTGKGHLIEDIQGTRAVKVFIGNNEKGMLNIPEFDTSSIFTRFRQLAKNVHVSSSQMGGLFEYLSEAIYDELLGKNVSVAGNFSVLKHGSNDIIDDSFQVMFSNLNRYAGDKKGAFEELQRILYNADPNGYRFSMYEGNIVYDDSFMGNNGLIQQVRNAREEIFRRAGNSKDKHHALWKSIADEIRYNEENNIFRSTVVEAIRTESVGGAMYMDPRMANTFGLKFHETIEELTEENTNINNFANFQGFIQKDGRKVSFQQYILDKIKEEAIDDTNPDTSKTPISRITGQKYKSANKTVQGLQLATEYSYMPDKLQNANNILDVDLDQLKTIPSGTDADELLKTGMFKMINKDGPVYSDQLQALANGKDLNNISVLRISLPNGMTVNVPGINGKTQKVNQVLVPLYDITPFKGEVQNTQRIRDLNNAIEVLKNHGTKTGIKAGQKELDEAISALYSSFTLDLVEQNKDSYIYQNLLRFPMKNSRMLHAEGAIAPVVQAMTDDYYKWYNVAESDYRDQIVKAVTTGDRKYAIDFSQEAGKYTTIKDGKVYYDDIIELGRENFEEFGVNFKQAGQDLFYDITNNGGKGYRSLISEMDRGFFDTDYAKAIIDRGIETKEVLRAMESQKEYDLLLQSLKGKQNRRKFIEQYGEEHLNKVLRELNILDSGFDTLAEKYLTDVGIFSMVGRWPTKDEGGLNIVRARLNTSIGRDDIRVTPALIERMHGDFDGDNLLNKLFLGRGGKFLSSTGWGRGLIAALTKSYETQVFKEIIVDELDKETGEWKKVKYISRNNRETGKLIEDQADKIKTSLTREITLEDGSKITIGSSTDYVSDTVNGKLNIARERTMIDKFMSGRDRQRVLTELGLQDFIELSVDEYSDDAVHKVFNVWNKDYGNMLKNLSVTMASIKARENKSGIGSVSNIDYRLNQVLLESLDDALQRGDKEAKKQFNSIKTFLHLGSTGFIPDTEQFAIDVKHVSQGATTTQIDKFNRGVQALFKGDLKGGEALIRQSMESRFKDKKAFEQGLQNLIAFSQNKKAKELYNLKLSPNIGKDLKSNLEARRKIEEAYQYHVKNGMGPNTAFSASFQAIQELRTAYNMGYYHNGVLQTLGEGQVFVSSENGELMLYRAAKNMQMENGSHVIEFNKLKLSDLTKKAKWEQTERIKGTAIEIQSILQEKFGSHRGYSIAEVLGNTTAFKSNLRKAANAANVNRYANMYSRGNIEMAEKFLAELQLDKSNKGAVSAINAFKNTITQQQYEDFITQARFIQANPNYQKLAKNGKRIFEANPSAIDDLLTNINRQIIEAGSNKKTSTAINVDKILRDALGVIANDQGLSNLSLASTVQRTTPDIFKGYEEKIIDIQKAKNDFSQFGGVQDKIDEMLNSYRVKNNSYISELRSKMSLSTTSDYDEVFGWKTGNLSDMRVGFNTQNGLFGRRFSDLSQADIDELLNYKDVDDLDTLSEYAINTTKQHLRKFKENYKPGTNGLQGARKNDINILSEINNGIKQSAEAAQEGLNAQGKRFSKEQAGELLKKSIQGAKDFTKNHPTATKGLIGLAALGLVSNILSGGNDSPLVPEVNKKASVGPTNNSGLSGQKAPSSNTGRKTVYVDNSSGMQFKMSAKSRNKIDQMQAAKQLSAQTGGDTNVNVYDDRSQVSNNWLERKFSELV